MLQYQNCWYPVERNTQLNFLRRSRLPNYQQQHVAASMSAMTT